MKKSTNNSGHKIIGDMLFQLRKAHNLNQSELAKLLNEPQSFVSKMENGERKLDIVELSNVLSHLKTSLTDFIIEFQNRTQKS